MEIKEGGRQWLVCIKLKNQFIDALAFGGGNEIDQRIEVRTVIHPRNRQLKLVNRPIMRCHSLGNVRHYFPRISFRTEIRTRLEWSKVTVEYKPADTFPTVPPFS
ncbi:hypothetical protein LINGRAHAP2_LOCUS3309 [Linum grandiflorum]